MKTIFKNSRLYLFLGMGFLFSCVHDDDFSIPTIVFEEPDLVVNTSILEIKNRNQGSEPVLIESEEDLIFEGYVVSSDESGNIHKQLYVQDAAENPAAGVVISTHATNLYIKFAPGQKVFFRVNGLYIGDFGGLPTLGTREGDGIGRIDVEDFEKRIFRSLEEAIIVPQQITIEEANDETKLATLVQLEGVQFPEDLLGEHYGNPANSQTVNRVVEDCEENTIILRNSGYSDFKNELLPDGNGTLIGLLSVFYGSPQLYIRDLSDVNMIGDRCEPSGGGGDPLPGGIRELPFFEDFENEAAGVGETVSIEDWKNSNVNGGERVWEVREFSRNKYAQTSAFGSYENPYEVWLITPGIFLPEESEPVFTFESKDGYYVGDALTVWISTDFDEIISEAEWIELEAEISRGNTDGYGADFVPSGEIDLSAFSGKIVHIGFRYFGSQTGVTTTFQIDNISVKE